MANNTIFDDVFQTIKEKMPELTIPLINEVFGTNYAPDAVIIQGKNEHQTANGKIITDSYLIIGSRRYHLECQSTEDNTMILRMIEYDFAIGLESARKENGKYRIRLPQSCVVYLRGDNPAVSQNLELILPDGRSIEYAVPIIRMKKYSIEQLLEKHLTMLLPFYIMRYEHIKLEDPDLRQKLYAEYASIEKYLEETYLQNGQEKAFRDILELISRIADYIFSKSENVRKELGEIMGGKVLELESDRLIKQGEQIGMKRGIERGMKRGIERGETAVTDLMQKLIKENRMDDLKRIATDTAYRKKLMQEMQEQEETRLQG